MTEHWSDPGAYPVAEGVHRIPLPLPMDGLKAVNVYVIETEDGLTCIDGGWAIDVSRKLFEESLKSIGHHPRDVTSFLVTHAHRDHYTQAVALRSEFGAATIALGLDDKPTLDLVISDLSEDPFAKRVRLGGGSEIAHEWEEWAKSSSIEPDLWLYPDTWITEDTTIAVGTREIAAISTPGHTAGHFVYADHAADLLFAGDHVLPTITPSVGFEVIEDTFPLRDYLASLAKVKAMPDLQLLPAHGATDMRSHQRVDELIAHHDHRLEQSLAAVEGGHHTAYAVARELPWTRHDRKFTDLDLFNGGMAVMETMVHLDLLWIREQVTRELVDGEYIYQAVSQD
ncbi:MAG TPA: MBL fold metallo-hydrolase [Nocardioidaceae bacterium]|nr:MBL fold metallo-hydrolase [Nocardioidaceae bacterium]